MNYRRDDVLLKMYFDKPELDVKVKGRYAIKMIHQPTGIEVYIPKQALDEHSDYKNITYAHEVMEYAVISCNVC